MQFNITLSTGNCTLGHSGAKGMNLTCVGHAISYSKAPITFISKHTSGDKFVDSSCTVGKAFGKPQTKVLFRWAPPGWVAGCSQGQPPPGCPDSTLSRRGVQHG